MIRMQIQLREEDAIRLREKAQSDGVSQAELVRRALAAYFDEPSARDAELARRALSVAGMIKSGPSDLSTRHDKYLVDELAAEIESNRVKATRKAVSGG